MAETQGGAAAAHLEELALGVLGGRERAEALAHLAHCSTCAEREQQLSEVSDALVDLVPAGEPPVGFESRVLARVAVARRDAIGPTRPDVTASERRDSPAPDRRRGRRQGPRRAGGRRQPRWQAAVLAVVACAAAFSGGWSLRGSGRDPAPAVTAAAPALVAALRDARGTVGQVYVNTGPHPWFYIGLAGIGPGTDSVHCFLSYRGGQVEDLGSYPVVAGAAGWGARILGDARDVTGARITTPAGVTIATAAF